MAKGNSVVACASHVTFRHLKCDVGDKISVAIASVSCIFFLLQEVSNKSL